MRRIDPKYSIRLTCSGEGVENENPEIVNMSGVPIPEDEPLILFRARDRHALATLMYYRELCASDACTDFHMEGIDNRIEAFADFRDEHADRMKQPGITKGK